MEGQRRLRNGLATLRKTCFTPGICQLKCLSNTFRKFDIDYSKHITFTEFQRGLKAYKLFFSSSYELDLFKAFDKDQSGEIDFAEFCSGMAPPLNGRRLTTAKYVFETLDKTGRGCIQVEDLKGELEERAKNHPKYKTGEWTTTQVLEGLLLGFKRPGNTTPQVTYEEFIEYYSSISPWVHDDVHFESSLKSCWAIDEEDKLQDTHTKL